MATDRYLEPYRQSAATHGTEFEVTLWANQAAQVRRFEVFAEMCYLSGKSILDAGCSRGDMAAFLVERHIEFDRYVGIDGLPVVIEHARSRRLPSCEFVAGDFLTNPELLSTGRPQIICISGALNTMTERQVMTVLESAWSAAGQTLLFNFLTDLALPAAPRQTTPARRHDGLRLLKWSTEKTGAVEYRQDYLGNGHDATVKMSK